MTDKTPKNIVGNAGQYLSNGLIFVKIDDDDKGE